ncbi:MAG: hypothetical protein Q9159_003575 [Coniocarpon cinnabarinum]
MRANYLADAVLRAFGALPNKAKPRVHPDGSREWTPLAGIVISSPADPHGSCVALGTGMRCLPADKLPLAKGRCLHDWHAEVVALRAFNHYLLSECKKLMQTGSNVSGLVRFRDDCEKTIEEPQSFALQDNLTISLFCTEAPCGDASMELTIDSQEDASPWTSQSRSLADGMLLSGRGHFTELGAVRRKPARGDAPSTLSKSCSDKLALRQCTSLLSSLTAILIHPANAYLDEILVPEKTLVRSAVERSFGPTGRMRGLGELAGAFRGGYQAKHFQVFPHSRGFEYSKPTQEAKGTCKGSNIATVWTPSIFEVLIGGTKQGHKQFSETGASAISRDGFCQSLREIMTILIDSPLLRMMEANGTYSNIKADALLAPRRCVKEILHSSVLKPWPKNDGDDFSLN